MNYSLEELAEKIRTEYKQTGKLSEHLQQSMKEVTENVHQYTIDKFSDVILPVYIEILNGPPAFQESPENQTRTLILELLSKIILTFNNFSQYEKIFGVLLEVMNKDNENNGITAARMLSDVLKSTTNHQFTFETTLKPLFSFISGRVQMFHNRIEDIMRNPMNKGLYQISQPPNKLIRSADSIKLIMEIPNLFVYACHFVEPNNDIVKNALNGAIITFINTLRTMPYTELAKHAPKPYFSELINTVVKLFHFTTLILKQQINNEKIREYLHSQTETIKSRADEMAESIMSFFKNVHEDFTSSRIELINYLRFHVKYLGADKFKNYINALLEDDVIFGKQKFKSIYGKNLIYQHWLETMQHLMPELNHSQIARTFDVISKNLYDNNLYNNIQYHSLILHQKAMETHFLNRRAMEGQEHTQKAIVTKILEKLILKFKQIKEKIVEINTYLDTKYPNHEVEEKNPMLLSNLPTRVESFLENDDSEWSKKKLDYIENYDSNIDNYLFAQSWIHYKTLTIYEDEDELVINCWTINPSTKDEYLKEIKDKIVPALFDSVRLVIDFISNSSSYAYGAQPGGQPRPQAKLGEEECYLLGKLLKYGLLCMDLLHNKKNPSEDKEKMMNFFLIFVSLQEPKNIKDIFETNFKSLFDITLKYSKYGSEESLQNLLSPLIDSPKVYEKTPFMKQYHQQIGYNWKVFAEILIKQLFLKLENSPDELGPFHPYYEYHQEFHSIIYKLIKMCFRCLNKHQQDQFIEGIFKQIIMVLFKKTHSSKYSIEYILLLRNLFKNILNQKSDNLFLKFQQLCEPGINRIDIIKNFVALYEAGLPELNDVLSELILILPLRTKYQLFNSKMLIGPIISALNLTDSDFLKRGLKTIDIILNNYQNYQNEDLDNLLVDVKQKLINKLYFFIWNTQENDILFATSKLLGKLGHYPRTTKVSQKFNPLNNSELNLDLRLLDKDGEGKVALSMSLIEAIRFSIDLIDQIFENKSLVPINYSCLENAWIFLQAVVHRLIEKQIDPEELKKAVLLSMNLDYPQNPQRDTYDIISNIFKALLIVASQAKKKELEEMFQNLANVFVVSYLMNPDKENPFNLIFLYSVLDNIKYRIIYIRGSHNDSYFNSSFAIIKSIIEKVQNIAINNEVSSDVIDHKLYHLILNRLVRVCHTKELINCHGAINCLVGLTEIIPPRYFAIHYFDILQSVFNVIQKIPEVIQLPVMDKCLELLRIMAGFYPYLQEQNMGLYHICDSLVNELLSANENQHEAAKFFLKQISKQTGTKFPSMFFETDRGINRYNFQRTEGETQIPMSKGDILNENLPISKILLLQDKIFSEIHTQKIQKEQIRYLYMLRNALDTLTLLCSERVLPYKFVDDREFTLTEDFKKIINLFETIINENDKIYKPYVYIIMEEEKKMDPVHGNQPQATSQNYTINKNILYDDDEFNVNIEDVDLTVKVWSKLISSALNLMQSLMTHRAVNTVVKTRIGRPRDQWNRATEEINETRNKIIFKFFNMMLRIEKNIRKTASRGLKTLIRLEIQPKDLLTEENLKVILRPILICLQQQHQIFNIPFLNVLRKLVKYLNQCFNRTLSDKLAEHLTKFMEILCSGNRRGQGNEGSNVDERKIASGIFYLFEYLPHASQYVDLIIKLNNKIDNTIVQLSGMHCMNYLMRKPLLRIVNCYASGSVELFLTNLQDYSKIFLYVLKADSSHAIRERLMRETQSFLERTFNNSSFDLTSQAIRIIRIISKRNPSWLLKNRIIPSLLHYWNNKEMKQPLDDDFTKDRNREEISQILKIFVQYCKTNRREIKIIFDMLPIFNNRQSIDFSFLHKFYRYYIPENYSPEEKRDIFLYFLAFLRDAHVPIETKANASYILIYPMMLKSFKSGKGPEVFTSTVIDQVCSLVSEPVKKKPVEYGRLEIEILQICGLIITYMKDEYMNQQGSGDDRKIELLKLGWNLMKNEDRVYANIAKLFICKFISKYGLLYEQTMQLYVSLLKGQEYINSHDNDIKLLSRKALDILIPYLPNVRHQGEVQSATPKWVSWTCKIFNEDNWINSQGYSFARFWQVFIRMHKIFAKYRVFFSTQMINSMQYLVLPHHQSSMYKKIAIDLALLYMEWHYQDLKDRVDKEQEAGKKLEIINQPFTEQTKDIREIFINFFIKLAINSCQDKEEKENITRKALFLLKKWLIISPGTVIKYQFIEKTLNNAAGPANHYRDGPEKKKSCFTVLMIISTLISFDKEENISNNMELIFKILTHPFSNCFTCDNPYIIQLISNLTKKLLALNNAQFQAKIIELVESGVNAYIQAYKSRSANQSYVKNAITIYTTIRISKVLLEYKPEELDKFFESFLEISKIFIELFDNRKFYNTPASRKTGDEDEDLLANIDDHYTEEGFENHKFSFSNLREFLIILLRILSQKLTKFTNPDSKEKIYMIELLESIMEKLPDIDLTIEVLSILNSLLLSDYYLDVKSHIPLVRGCFSTKEKILYFLEYKKVQSVMEKHSSARHDNERVIRKYSKLIIDLLRAIPLREIETERLRKLMVILNKYVPADMSDKLFQIVDNHFGDSFKKKIMFFFYEFSDEAHLEDTTEGDDDLLTTVVNYLIYAIPQFHNIDDPLLVFPLNPQQTQVKMPMEVENATLNECIKQVNDFVSNLKSYHTNDLLMKFRKLLTVDYAPKKEILRFYFNLLFTMIWNKLPRADQQVVIQVLEDYLAKGNCPASANAILYTADSLYPAVKIRPEIIQYLAKTNHTWHTSLYLLEKYSENETDEELENIALSLNELYTRLDEKDYSYGLKRLMCEDPRVKSGLSLSQHRLWVKAGKSFSSYIEQASYDPTDISDVLHKKVAEEGWMNVHKQLNDWASIQGIIKGIENIDLHIELAWQTKDRRTLEKFIMGTDGITANSLMIQSIIRLGQFAETIRPDEAPAHKKVEEAISGSLYCSLLEWNALPKCFTNSHKNILVRLQSLVEIDEASSIISKIKEKEYVDVMKEHFAHQLIAHMDIWKSRMPSKVEDLVIWKAIIDQRNFLYGLVKKRMELLLNNASASAGATAALNAGPGSAGNTVPSTPSKELINDVEKKLGYFSDIIWNNLKYSSIERRFDYFGQTKGNSYRHLGPDNLQTPGEIYLSVKEQIMWRLNGHFDYENALRIANNAINNEILSIEHKSEMHRLKVLLNMQLGKLEEANNECIEALKICDTNWKCWHTWAVFCFKSFCQLKQFKWAEQTIVCFTNAIKYKPHKTRLLVADILWMLSYDDRQVDRQKMVLKQFEKAVDELPVWIWIIWIPQLLAAITKSRVEARASLEVLKKIAKEYPQALFYYLKRFKLQSNASHISNEISALNINDIFEEIKRTEPILYECLELFSDFIPTLNITQEEKMINEINNLAVSLYLLDSATQLDRFRLRIFLMLRSFESHIQKIPFQEIIRMQSANLSEILSILKNFINNMKENYKPHAKPYQRIEPIKLMQLQALLTDILEIPGQYDVNQEPSPEKHVKLVEIGKEVECIEKSRMLIRILSFRGTNGKVYQYTINNKPTSTNAQNESLVVFLNSQLKQVMNIRFASNKETAVRHLKLKGLNEFFVNWEVSIAEYKPKLKSMSDLLDDHMVSQGLDTDHALELYLKEKIFENIEAKKAIFRQMDKLVPKDLFRKFVLKCVRNLDEYYLFRNNFIASYGMENFFSYIISNEMLLENMFVDAAKGTFYYLDMKPNFSDQGQINRESAHSSIRISKNIENFITNMGLEGPFASCFIAGSLAFTRYDTDLSTLLFVYVRDCVVKGEQGEVPKKVCMDNAVELKARALSFGFEDDSSRDQISQKIYDIIIELTRGDARGTIPKKYRYWF